MTVLLDQTTHHALLDNRLILVVDDEEPIRRLLAYLLQSHGYTVESAADAREARQKLAAQPYALMLCDVNMPGESGMDLVRHTLIAHPHTAAIMVTGLDSSVLANAALDVGAFGYIVKPFESNEVLIDVANALRRRRLELKTAIIGKTSRISSRTERLHSASLGVARAHGKRTAPVARGNDTALGHRRRVP